MTTTPSDVPAGYNQPGYPQQGYPQQGYPQQGYPQQGPSPYAPRPLYRALERRQKRSAFWAGAIGLNLMSFGSGIVLAAALIGVIVAIFAGYSDSAALNSGLRGFGSFLDDISAPIWIIVGALLGLIVFAAGMFGSVAILQAGRVRRPWAVTWSAFGISVPVLFVINFVLWFFGQLVSAAYTLAFVGSAVSGSGTDEGSIAGAIAVAIGGLIFAIALVAVAGSLAWWWMSHAFRERVPVVAHAVPDPIDARRPE